MGEKKGGESWAEEQCLLLLQFMEENKGVLWGNSSWVHSTGEEQIGR